MDMVSKIIIILIPHKPFAYFNLKFNLKWNLSIINLTYYLHTLFTNPISDHLLFMYS